MDIESWRKLYEKKKNITDETKKHVFTLNLVELKLLIQLRVTDSRAADNAGINYRDVCIIPNQHQNLGERNCQTMSMNSDRTSKLMAIRKKDKPPDKVKNLRTIQILPTNVRLLERSVVELKNWLVNRLKEQEELQAFLPGKSTKSCVLNWMNAVN